MLQRKAQKPAAPYVDFARHEAASLKRPIKQREGASRLVENARRMGIDAFHTAAALDIVAPLAGRTWRSVCVWCLERLDPRDEAEVYRVADAAAGGCSCCAYSGRDTIVAALVQP